MLGALAFLGLMGAGLSLIMSLAEQADQTRSTHAALSQGRLASEFAESALEETLATSGALLKGAAGGPGLRQRLLERAVDGRVEGPRVFGTEVLESEPAKTRALIAAERSAVELSPVRLRPLGFAVLQNQGEIELECTAKLRMVSGPPVVRRVTAVHSFVLGGDGASFRLVPVPLRLLVDRRPKL